MRNGKTLLRRIIRALGISEEGGAIAETALTAPFLAVLVYGSVEFARVAYTAIEVTNAAQAGVSYAVQSGLTASDSDGIKWAAINDGVNIPGMTASSSLGYKCSDGSATTGSPPACPNGLHLVETVTVQTQVSMDPLVHIAGLPKTYTLYGAAVQNCYQ